MSAPRLSLAAVGDICLGDSLISLGFGTRSLAATKAPEYLFESVQSLLDGCDLRFGNLESVLSDIGLDASCPTTRYLRGSPESIDVLTMAGFDVLNVANNHMLQYGADAFQETVSLIEEAGIMALGLRGAGGLHSRPVVLERCGTSVGFLGYSYEWEQYHPEESLYAVGCDEHIAGDVAKLRPQVDSLVVSLHWGLEYMIYPSSDMIRLARRLLDLGVDVVLGHHPHVPMGQESRGRGNVVYSLGNFVFDKTWWPPSLRTLVSIHELDPNRTGPPPLRRVPARISSGYRPELLTDEAAQCELVWLDQLDGFIESRGRRPEFWYHLKQKSLLAALVPLKMAHIARSFTRYEKDVGRWLIKHKIFRLG